MVGRTMFAMTVAAGLLMAGSPARAELARRHDAPPGVRIWTDHGDVYRDGEPVQVFFRTENDAYVTILRVETGGLVRVLFPRSPGDPNLAHGGETYVVPGVDDRDAFYVDDAPGIGYVFAIASSDPFSYDAFEADDRWSFQDINNLSDGRIHGDPYASLQDLAQHIMPQGYADYDTHLLPYYVNQHYDYPRFLCYDCHAYTPYAYWDPYGAWCPRFSLVVYYNPFYFYPSYWYPTRYYRGTNVVYVRPGLTGSQYVFKTRSAQSSPYLVYRDRRDGGDPPGSHGIRGVDIGGTGSIPSPGGRRTVGGGDATPGGRRIAGGGAVAPGEGRRVVGGGSSSPALGEGRRTVGGGSTSPALGEGRRTVGGGSAAPQGAAEGSGRRYIGETRAATPAPRIVGPDRPAPAQAAPNREVAPTQPRRGIYIDPGMRTPGTPAPPAPGPRDLRPAPRFIPPQEQPRAAPGYAPRAAPTYAPRSAPGYSPRPAPATSAPAPRAEPSRAPSRGPSPSPAVGRSPAPASRPESPSLERRRR